MKLLAIDPGTTESGWCVFDGARVLMSGQADNLSLLAGMKDKGCEKLAIEMVASYGMPVGREVFETCVWIGRFMQAWYVPSEVQLVYRQEAKLHLCKSVRAKDGNIRQALLDRFGEVGTKKNPGPLYGVSGHVWSALAVAVTAMETKS